MSQISMMIFIFFTVFSLTSAVYYRNFPYSSRVIKTRAQHLQSDLQRPSAAAAAAASAAKLSAPPAHLFVLRPDYTLRNINKVADVVRNFLQKRLQLPIDDTKRSPTITLYDY